MGERLRAIALRGSLLAILGAAGLAAALLAPAARTAPQAAGSATYVDEFGESGTAADLRQITVSDEGAGNLSFAFVTVGFQPPAGSSSVADRIFVCLDSDENWSTGSPGGGCDYAFAIERSTGHQVVFFYQWNGTVLASQIDPAGVTVTGDGDAFTVSFNESLIGGATGFDFYAYSTQYSATKTLGNEYAPSHGWWRFPAPAVTDTGTTATAPPPTTPAPEPSVVGVPVTSGPVVAGRRFQAIFSVTGTAGATGRVTVAGRPVKASTRYFSGNEHVSLTLPKSARGQVLRIRVVSGSFVRSSAFKVGAP